MSDTQIALAVAFGTLLLNFIGFLLSGSRWFHKSKEDTDKKIEDTKTEFNLKIEAVRNEFKSDNRVNLHDWGEALSALRTKMNEMELWNRDNLVSKTTFGTVLTDVKDMIKSFKADLEKRFDKIDERLKQKED